jgi:hypothetical protein
MSASIFAKLGVFAETADAALAHAAGWVLAKLSVVQEDVATMEATHPLIVEAIASAKAYAVAHGIPTGALENAGEALLALAQKVAAGPQPAPAPTVNPPAAS